MSQASSSGKTCPNCGKAVASSKNGAQGTCSCESETLLKSLEDKIKEATIAHKIELGELLLKVAQARAGFTVTDTPGLELRVVLCHPDAILPSKSTEFAAGFDLYGIDSVCLLPGESHLFRTGIMAAVPHGYCAVLFDRSGMGGKRNIHRLAGVIDEDYRGEWLVSLINLSDGSQDISRGDKIVQALILPVPVVRVVEVNELSDTERGEAGFGSSGA